MRKLIMHVRTAKGGTFDEVYMEGERGSFPVGHPDPRRWAVDIIAFYNSGLRPGESARELERAEVIDVAADTVSLAHVWGKTSLTTVSDAQGVYDRMKCDHCGLTGKRFGIGSTVKVDSVWRVPSRKTCSEAQKILAKRKARS